MKSSPTGISTLVLCDSLWNAPREIDADLAWVYDLDRLSSAIACPKDRPSSGKAQAEHMLCATISRWSTARLRHPQLQDHVSCLRTFVVRSAHSADLARVGVSVLAACSGLTSKRPGRSARAMLATLVLPATDTDPERSITVREDDPAIEALVVGKSRAARDGYDGDVAWHMVSSGTLAAVRSLFGAILTVPDAP